MRDQEAQLEPRNYAPLKHQGKTGARWSIDGDEWGDTGWLHVLAPSKRKKNDVWRAAWVDHVHPQNSGTAVGVSYAALWEAAQANGCPWMEALHKTGTWVLARYWQHPSADADVVVPS